MSSPSSLDHEDPPLEQSVSPPEERSLLMDLETSPIILRAQAAFRRDLPGLLKGHRRRWVAYHGERRVAIGSSKRQLFQHCREIVLPAGEILVRFIEPEISDEIDWNESRDI